MDPFNLRRRRRAPLDATSGREVVFCHQCRNEWYNDEYPGLDCPECGSGAAEIVTPGHDPRDMVEFPTPNFGLRFPTSRPQHPHVDSDSDPEEADIDSFGREATGRNTDRTGRQSGASSDADADRRPGLHMNNSDAILQRFADMLMNDFGGARTPNRGAPSPLFPPRSPGESGQAGDRAGGQASGQAAGDDFHPFSGIFPPGAPATFQRTTIRSGPSGSTTFTFVSSSSVTDGSAPGFPSPFPTLLGQLMGGAGSPLGDNANRPEGGGGGAGARPAGGPVFGGGFQELLATLLNPQSAVHGDAVYSQEALDRIITSLMEANPQSNAAPPASEDAIQQLERKKVDEKMLGAEGKAECTICIDELNKGDEVTVLPCSHWFHGECVTLWLKEHNTCPICRASIEQRNGQSGGSQHQPQQQQQPQTSNLFTNNPPSPRSMFSPHTSFFGGQSRSRPDRFTRSPRENEERLNAIRNAGYATELRSNNPFLLRRNSRSPPAARRSHMDSIPRQRARSPSFHQDQDSGVSPYDRREPSTSARSGGSDNRESRERVNQSGQSSHGRLSWIRDHFGRGFGGGTDRDRERGR